MTNNPANDKEAEVKNVVLALASAGGHWVQLNRLRPAFEGSRLIFATTQADYKFDVPNAEFYKIPDATRWNKFKLIQCALSIFLLILKVKPDTIITTGAAPGYFAIRIGKLFRIKTIWVDSIANVETLSLSGQKAGRFANLWLTQWPHLASTNEHGPLYYGNVIDGSLNEIDQNSNNTDKEKKIKEILITVGSDVPFDRMISAIDTWAENKQSNLRVFAQIGRSSLEPKNMDYCQFLTPAEFQNKLVNCDVVIAHAGMGTILSAMKNSKPILVMPRHGKLGETRNDHQIATAERLLEMGKIEVAFNEEELVQRLFSIDSLTTTNPLGPYAAKSLTDAIHDVIHD